MSDVTTKWQKSTFCADSACLEVARIGDRIAIRNNTRPECEPLMIDLDAWSAFVAGITAGEYTSL
jgi:hypothetical protein